jgi:competence protein ComGC
MRSLREFGREEGGTSLIEMMIAVLVLAIGLIGASNLAVLAIRTNTMSRRDSTSAALAEMVIGQISAVPVGGGVTSVTITDCAAHSVTVNTSGTSAGSGANLNTGGTIDFTQTFASVTAGYAMKYTVCGVSNGAQFVYDMRWNIQLSASGNTEFVVVGVQPASSSSGTFQQYAPAVNVRTVVGNDGY